MQSLKRLKQASRDVGHKPLALPPGFRRIYQDQKIDLRQSEMMFGSAVALPAIQLNDVDDPNFGKFVFMLGYDDI